MVPEVRVARSGREYPELVPGTPATPFSKDNRTPCQFLLSNSHGPFRLAPEAPVLRSLAISTTAKSGDCGANCGQRNSGFAGRLFGPCPRCGAARPPARAAPL